MINRSLRTGAVWLLAIGIAITTLLGPLRTDAQSGAFLQLLQSYCGPKDISDLSVLNDELSGSLRPFWSVSQWIQACTHNDNWFEWLITYGDYSETAAQSFGLPKAYLDCLMWTESGFKASAVSRVGAIGLSQVMPNTARFLNRLVNEPLHESLTAFDWERMKNSGLYPGLTNPQDVTLEQLIDYYRRRLNSQQENNPWGPPNQDDRDYYQARLALLIERQTLEPMWRSYLQGVEAERKKKADRGVATPPPLTGEITEDLLYDPRVAVGVSALYVRLILHRLDQAFLIHDRLDQPAPMDQLLQVVTAFYNRGHGQIYESLALANSNNVGEWIELAVDGSTERRQQVYQAATCLNGGEPAPYENSGCCKQPLYPENAPFPIDWEVVNEIKSDMGCPR